MKKIIVLLFIGASLALAQTTVTVTITVPSAAVPVFDAYRKTLCATTDAAGACIALQYTDLVTMVKSIITGAIVNQISTPAAIWAITNNDASLPTSIKAAITAAGTGQVAVDAQGTAAKLASAIKVTVN